MTNSLMTMPPESLAFLSRQMKLNILDFATGVRPLFVPFGGATLEMAIILLESVERAADERGIDRTGDEWGQNIDPIRKVANESLDWHGVNR